MKQLVFWLVAVFGTANGTLNVVQSGFRAGPDGTPSGWAVWSARSELAPRAYVDQARSRQAPGSLAISGNHNPAVYGGWEHTVEGVQGGKWYRLVGTTKAQGWITNRCRSYRGWTGQASKASEWDSRIMRT